MEARKNTLRIGIYGTGSWANQTHIPNLLKLEGVQIAAVCDVDPAALQATATRFAIPRTYRDGHEMLEREELDALFSVVPAFARTDVEAIAAQKGIHLFSEKPQALDMAVARRIDAAVRQSGVLSTVCFRERYRPLFQEARQRLQDKRIVHIRFQSFGSLPSPPPSDQPERWWYQMDKAGGAAFDWGVHAVDYSRFLSGLDVAQAQAFYHHPSGYCAPLSCSFNFCLTGGATMTMNFLATTPVAPPHEPWFTVFFEGGYLAVHRYDYLEVNGEKVYEATPFDPWFEQDRRFVEAIRSGDRSLLLNDYRDGLFSLAPVLAGWESARRGGECLDVTAFMEA